MDRNFVFRTERFAPDFPGFVGKELISQGPIESIPVMVDAESEPAEFTVVQNYPNPFNAMTTIEFTIPADGLTRVNIYNTAGQKIRELVSSYLSAGRHSVVWDGTDQLGNWVPTGLYITRMISNEISISNRMLMIK
jgi:hypothetical protein